MRAIGIGLGVCAMAMAMACGSASTSSNELVLRGAVSPTARRLDNARAVAVTASGKAYVAYLDASGAFTLKLPIGSRYKLLFTNTLPAGNQLLMGHLAVHGAAGATRWIAVGQGGTYNLGTLRLAGATSGTVKTMSDGAGDTSSGGGDSSGDYESHEDDHESESVCSDNESSDDNDKDVELEADNDPHDSLKGEGSSESDDADKEKETEDDNEVKSCGTAGGGGSGGSAGGGSAPPATSPGGGVGASCKVTANCASGLLCAASICTNPPR